MAQSEDILLISAIAMIVYCVIGIPGNLVAGAVFLRPNMRGPYTGLVVGLAIFDTLVLANMVLFYWWLVVDSTWILDHVEVLRLFTWICTAGSRYFILAIAAERAYVVAYPIHAHTTKDTRGLWSTGFVVAFVVVVPVLIFLLIGKGDQIWNTFVLIIPLPGVVVLCVPLYRQLKQAKVERRTMTSQEELPGLSATRMVLAITVVFGICASLDFVNRLLRLRGGNVTGDLKDYYATTIVQLSIHFDLINSSVNFIIYGALSKRFRREARDMFGCRGENPIRNDPAPNPALE